MSPSLEENPSSHAPYISVFGAAYVPERHADSSQTKLAATSQREAGVAGLWLVFYAFLVGIPLVTSIGSARLVELASVILK